MIGDQVVIGGQKGCEEAFVKLKKYMASPPILCKPQMGTPLCLYFSVTERAVSSVLVQEQSQAQRPIYFASKVLQGPEIRYQALEKAALALVFSARRLRHYFNNFTVVVMTDLPIQKVLKKPDVAGRMMKWAVELSEFDIQYEPRGPIKGQVFADFVVELSSIATPAEGLDFCTALVVGSDDVAPCYSIGVLARRQVGKREGSRGLV